MEFKMARPGKFISDAEMLDLEKAERKRQHDDRIRHANIPQRYSDAICSDCRSEVGEYALCIENGGRDWLMLVGGNGTGKTYAACAIANRLAWSRRVMFTTVKQMIDAIQADRSAIRNYYNVPFLVLDDLGKEDSAAWKQPDVFDVIQRRDANMKPTVFTTNLTPNQMLNHYSGDELNGAAIVSRLRSATIVKFDGEDRRKK